MKEREVLITLEGGEGAGKSTQIAHLLRNLRKAGIEAIGTREPGGSPGAEILRKVLLSGSVARLGPAAEAILFAAARVDHIDKKIEPALAAGTFVVCDRFADSTRAYQGARGQVDPQFLRALERITLGDVRPGLTLILDLPVAEGLARAAARRGAGDAPDRFEREDFRISRKPSRRVPGDSGSRTGALRDHRRNAGREGGRGRDFRGCIKQADRSGGG